MAFPGSESGSSASVCRICNVWLNVWNANAEKLEFVHGRATRTFSTPGKYSYGTGGGLLWYEEWGVVRVF